MKEIKVLKVFLRVGFPTGFGAFDIGRLESGRRRVMHDMLVKTTKLVFSEVFVLSL